MGKGNNFFWERITVRLLYFSKTIATVLTVKRDIKSIWISLNSKYPIQSLKNLTIKWLWSSKNVPTFRPTFRSIHLHTQNYVSFHSMDIKLSLHISLPKVFNCIVLLWPQGISLYTFLAHMCARQVLRQILKVLRFTSSVCLWIAKSLLSVFSSIHFKVK